MSTFWAFFALFWAFWGYFLGLWGYFCRRGQVQKNFWSLLLQSINFGFGSTVLSSCFYFGQIWGLFCPFWAFGGFFGGLRSGSKTFLGPTYVVNQLWFWKYSPIFLLLLRPNLGLFLRSGSDSKTFLEYTNVDYKFLFWKCNPIF